jgi:hypothetical protein
MVMKCLNVLFPALFLAALLFAAGCGLAADEDAREKGVPEADTPQLERKVTPAESNADILIDSWKPAPVLLLRDLGMIIPWDRKNALWYLKDLTRPKDKDAGYWEVTFAQRPDTYKEMERGDYDTVRLVVGPEKGKTAKGKTAKGKAAKGKIEKAFPAYKYLGRRYGLHVFGAKQGKRKWADWEHALRKGLAEKDIAKLPGSGRSWIVGRADCDEIHLDPESEDVDDGPRHGFHLDGGMNDPATGQFMDIFMHYSAPGYYGLDTYNNQRILAVGTSECLTVVVPLDFFLPKEKK